MTTFAPRVYSWKAACVIIFSSNPSTHILLLFTDFAEKRNLLSRGQIASGDLPALDTNERTNNCNFSIII